MMKQIALCLLLAGTSVVQAQIRNTEVYELPHLDKSNERNVINIPGFGNYETLKCDFHIHTVFSDGLVWPDMRVQEAWQEGLDAIAITDHIEYRPRKEVLKGDRNESYKIAKKAADAKGFIVIQGTEITRSKPLGHLNALFIQDAEAMDVEDPLKAIDEAKRQGAFILWNHPGWPDDKSTLYPVHEQLLKADKIDGIEVFNYAEYYPAALDWCDRYGKAYMANTDAHGLVASVYGWGDKLMRPLTLVFASERSERGIRDALSAGRTVAYFDGKLAGSPELLEKLLKACLSVRPIGDNRLEVTNRSDLSFEMTGGGALYRFPARKVVLIDRPKTTAFTVENCLTGNKKLTLSFPE
ncbi:CehA/McbA family metallohydrolase [Parabacteroides sp. ZJ-118]|uniref:CehA/McbA family metallohydrolase n=1 Tax=Parabacteroides sp. ZJ-118 TaxID=2709398 RepID=UPI001F14E6EE|nr:CehA/McbA family metallohydrolase [Parabacteroides sp. ZJ-118]